MELGIPHRKIKMMEKYWKINKKMMMMNYKKKGQFVVYTKEGNRFVVPLCYLDHPIFKILLEMAEEEYGLTGHGPLIVPCEKELMEYVLSLLKKKPPLFSDVDHENALFSTCKSVGTAGAFLSTGSFSPAMMMTAAVDNNSSGHHHHHHHSAMLSLMSCS